jgi:predicted ribosome quality control (RQC) complex YloA/Tae2 family protein
MLEVERALEARISDLRATVNTLETENTMLARQVREQREKGLALVKKLDEIDKALQGVLTLAFAHGVSYDGPTYLKEVEDFLGVLQP